MEKQTAGSTSKLRPLYVNQFSKEILPIKGTVGMTLAPGKKGSSLIDSTTWNRDLGEDLDHLKKVYKTDLIVSLMEDFEFDMLEISNFKEMCAEKGIRNIRFHIVDGSVPEEKQKEEYFCLLKELKKEAENGTNIVIHCRGGLGRTGTLATCLLILFGYSSTDALNETRKCRVGTVENSIQEKFIEEFGKEHSIKKE